MLRDFIAIDFETANQEPSSVCSVGVVMVRDGQRSLCRDSTIFVIRNRPLITFPCRISQIFGRNSNNLYLCSVK